MDALTVMAVSATLGMTVGFFIAWLLFTLRGTPLPTPSEMSMIVTQAIKAISNAAIIEGSGSKKHERAVELLRTALATVNVELDDRLLHVIVEAVYQFDAMTNKPQVQ